MGAVWSHKEDLAGQGACPDRTYELQLPDFPFDRRQIDTCLWAVFSKTHFIYSFLFIFYFILFF